MSEFILEIKMVKGKKKNHHHHHQKKPPGNEDFYLSHALYFIVNWLSAAVWEKTAPKPLCIYFIIAVLAVHKLERFSEEATRKLIKLRFDFN